MQRTWIRAVEGLSGFGWRSTLSTWLGGIAVNCARELWREGRLGADLDAAEGGPRLVPPSHEDRIDLDRAIERLPAGYRQVFVLHDVEGYTHEEIGRLLGIDAGTSRSQLSHARRRLRASLEPPAWRAGRRGNG